MSDEVWLWSSVAGLMSADPELIPTARVIDEIDYADAAEMAYYGARVLHLKMIAPLQRAEIPLRVKSIHQPEASGTYIHQLPESSTSVLGVTSLPGIAIRPNEVVEISPEYHLKDPSRLETLNLLRELDQLSPILSGSLELMFISQSSSSSLWCVCATARATIEDLAQLGDALCQPETDNGSSRWEWLPVTMVTVVGGSLVRYEQSGAFNQKMAGLQVLGQTHGAHLSAMSYILLAEDGANAVSRLHDILIQQN